MGLVASGGRSGILRAAAVAFAVAACVWLGFGVRQAHDTATATSILSAGTTLSATGASRVNSLLDAAGALNPDRNVNLLRGQLALEQGHPDVARRWIAPVTRSEPDNVAAWLWLARASSDDRQTFLRALRRILELEPRLPPGLRP